MLHLTSLITCLAGLLCAIAAKATGRHGRPVIQIATAIFLPRPDAEALGDSVRLGGLRRKRPGLVWFAS